ncbi:MAG: N-6 DNA methylase, partial [Armatimonadetes bacterium]|nr:N-6 DNA methylase [Armatimonadota bacterium]
MGSDAEDRASAGERLADRFFRECRALFLRARDALARSREDPAAAHAGALELLTRLMALRFLRPDAPLPNRGEVRRALEDTTPLFSGAPPLPWIPDDLLGDALSLIGRFPFARRERDPREPETAVDPEILARIHESLAEGARRRSDAGIFYTPRAEIALMCRLALVDALTRRLGERHRPLLYRVVFARSPEEKRAADAAAAVERHWPALDRLLARLTVLDPACGCGSFLVGMLRLLGDLQARAARQTGAPEHRRQHTLAHRLHGADVMEWACRVARLRLALAATDLPAAPSAPCPALGRQASPIRHGDALLEDLFPEVAGGFDIVIGNPPYVRQEAITDPLHPGDGVKPGYKERLARAAHRAFPGFFGYREETGRAARPLDAKSDLYVYFFIRGLALAAPGGTLCYLTSNSWLDVGYGAALQELLLRHSRPRLILDSHAERSFSGADVNTVI